MRHLALVVATALSMLPLTAEAAGLGPTKPSQLFSAYTFGPCPVPGHTGSNSVRLSKMVGSDGTTIDLAIPPKKVLVITDAVAATGAAQSGNVIISTIVVGSQATGNLVAARIDTATAGGVVTAPFEFPSGIAVRSGSTVCIETLNLSVGGFTGTTSFVHGYFAADK